MNSNYQLAENLKNKEIITNLIQISLDGLHEMYLPDQFKFALKKKVLYNTFQLEDSSIRYTLINLIGLHKAESHNIPINIDINKILLHQINNAEKYNGVGEIGLLLWSAALISPENIPNILTRVNFKTILMSFKDAKSKLTTELSWLLTGLLMASTFCEEFKSSIGNLTEKVYSEIRNNYGGTGIFKHQTNNTIVGKFRAHIATFADQIYTIYAFSLYSQQTNNKEALLIARECALKLCELQGNDGEWMWHYNSKTGNIVNSYPIYSVNQLALAPIALSAIQKASGIDFSIYINKGLEFILKNNSNEIIDMKRNIILDGISSNTMQRKFNSTFNFVRKVQKSKDGKIKSMQECSSYNYGWILHALSGKLNQHREKPVNNRNNFNQKLFFLN
jgi:hypothetical protein